MTNKPMNPLSCFCPIIVIWERAFAGINYLGKYGLFFLKEVLENGYFLCILCIIYNPRVHSSIIITILVFRNCRIQSHFNSESTESIIYVYPMYKASQTQACIHHALVGFSCTTGQPIHHRYNQTQPDRYRINLHLI